MALKISKILYATDLSENSTYAFPYATDLARSHNAKIVIMHVIEPGPLFYGEFYTGEAGLKQKRREEAVEEIKDRLQAFCRRTEAETGTPCIELVDEILVPIGHPPEEILNAADREACDVIVLGTHGKGVLAHTFLGSVSSAVLHRTRRPVFIIPLPSEKAGYES